MEDLARKTCVPCHGEEPPLGAAEIEALLPRVPDWDPAEVDGAPRLVRTFDFDDFAAALAFADRVGAAAETEGHHPEITVGWGYARVSWWTHATGGLHRNDFIMAAKTDALLSG